jgi:hypothetical protein
LKLIRSVSVFCPGKNRVVKIARNEFRPLLEGNSPTSSNLILKINMCYKWINRELEKFTW